MKAIMISIRPQYVAKILSGEKTIEIRKKFPKDFVGWVYIYVTKKGGYCYHAFKSDTCTMENVSFIPMTKCNGKVVARFWCDTVEEINATNLEKFTKDSCLTIRKLEIYLWSNILSGTAIHINNLEIFDKPKEISEFYGAFKQKRYESIFGNNAIELDKKYGGLRQPTKSGYEYVYPLTRAPQSYYYVEV